MLNVPGDFNHEGLGIAVDFSRQPNGSFAAWTGSSNGAASRAPSGMNGSTKTSSTASRRFKITPCNGAGLTTPPSQGLQANRRRAVDRPNRGTAASQASRY